MKIFPGSLLAILVIVIAPHSFSYTETWSNPQAPIKTHYQTGAADVVLALGVTFIITAGTAATAIGIPVAIGAMDASRQNKSSQKEEDPWLIELPELKQLPSQKPGKGWFTDEINYIRKQPARATLMTVGGIGVAVHAYRHMPHMPQLSSLFTK